MKTLQEKHKYILETFPGIEVSWGRYRNASGYLGQNVPFYNLNGCHWVSQSEIYMMAIRKRVQKTGENQNG